MLLTNYFKSVMFVLLIFIIIYAQKNISAKYKKGKKETWFQT